MKIRSFRARVLLALAALVALAQLASTGAVLYATDRSVLAQARDELTIGGRVFERLMSARAEQLQDSVGVLAADFGFRQAVATDDVPTVRSALRNHGARVEAGVVLLVSLDGAVRASTLNEDATGGVFPFPDVLAAAERDGGASSVVVLDDRLWQVVMVGVTAPLRIAWVCMGFPIDDALAGELRSLTGLEVSFKAAGNDSADRLFASTLPERLHASVLGALADLPLDQRPHPSLVEEGGHLTIERPLAEHDGARLSAVLQSSVADAYASFAGLRVQLVLVSVGALVLATLVAVQVSRGVTRPVRSLVAAARRVAAGDYTVQVQNPGSDELGLLGHTFNRMLAGIAEREARITHQAGHDSLTDLPNRALARDRLESLLVRAGGSPRGAALVMLDLVQFRNVNETLGHHNGDRILCEVAQRLSVGVRRGDTVARIGGDEFLLLLHECDAERALHTAAALVAALRAPVGPEEARLSLGVTTGVALFPAHGDQAETLLRRVEVALHAARKNASGLAFYRPGDDERHLRRLRIVRELRRAIEEDQLCMHYQPKLTLADGDTFRAEALVRWTHEELGFMPPDEFIGLAEQSGNIQRLTRWVLRDVLRQMRVWRARGLDVAVAVNLSPLDLLDDDLPLLVERLLAEHEVPAARLTLEITESAVMREPERALEVLRRLREAGLSLAIDDFGVGHSSLAQLRRLPVQEIKIDRSFVQPMLESADDEVIVRSTIELGHNMGLVVVAEGVETEAMLARLRELGCDVAQGYLLSRPLPAAGFEQWLAESPWAGGCEPRRARA